MKCNFETDLFYEFLKFGGFWMPYYLPQAVLVWLIAIWVIQWNRWRELLVYGLLGGYLGLLQDHLGGMFGLWQYSDIGLINTHDQISTLIATSAAPLFAMFFVQGLTPGEPLAWRRIAVICAVAMGPEVLGLYTGNISHGGWWSIWASVVAHAVLWTGIWSFHRVLTATPSRR